MNFRLLCDATHSLIQPGALIADAIAWAKTAKLLAALQTSSLFFIWVFLFSHLVSDPSGEARQPQNKAAEIIPAALLLSDRSTRQKAS
jgi:hypothetical protein